MHARIKRCAIGSFEALRRTSTATSCLPTTTLGFFVFVFSSSSAMTATVRLLIMLSAVRARACAVRSHVSNAVSYLGMYAERVL